MHSVKNPAGQFNSGKKQSQNQYARKSSNLDGLENDIMEKHKHSEGGFWYTTDRQDQKVYYETYPRMLVTISSIPMTVKSRLCFEVNVRQSRGTSNDVLHNRGIPTPR